MSSLVSINVWAKKEQAQDWAKFMVVEQEQYHSITELQYNNIYTYIP